MMRRRVMAFGAAWLLALACTPNPPVRPQEPLSVSICPADAQAEATDALNLLPADEPLRLADLLTRASNLGFSVEETKLRLRYTQCVERPDDPSMTIHVIHAGFNASRSHTRHFVIIHGADEVVTGIEVQRVYPACFFFC